MIVQMFREILSKVNLELRKTNIQQFGENRKGMIQLEGLAHLRLLKDYIIRQRGDISAKVDVFRRRVTGYHFDIPVYKSIDKGMFPLTAVIYPLRSVSLGEEFLARQISKGFP